MCGIGTASGALLTLSAAGLSSKTAAAAAWPGGRRAHGVPGIYHSPRQRWVLLRVAVAMIHFTAVAVLKIFNLVPMVSPYSFTHVEWADSLQRLHGFAPKFEFFNVKQVCCLSKLSKPSSDPKIPRLLSSCIPCAHICDTLHQY